MRIVTRKEWGARFSAGFRAAPLPAKELYLHHSVTTAANGPETIKSLERIGQSRFGGGISYTFAITPDGTVYEGHGIDRQGAHTGGRNSISRAIVWVGNYDIAYPSPEMVRATTDLIKHGAQLGWWPLGLTGGHRDAPGAATACPGRFAYDLIPDINNRVRGDVAPPTHDPYPLLRIGVMDNEYVMRIQSWGNRWFPSYKSTPLSVDGDFGPATERFVKEFQVRVSIQPDGIIGPITWGKMVDNGYR